MFMLLMFSIGLFVVSMVFVACIEEALYVEDTL